MEYRKLPHGEEMISMIGMGTGGIVEMSDAKAGEIISLAIDNGINFFDMASSEITPYRGCAVAFEGRRDKVYVQMHFGATYDDGKYGWTRDLDKIKSSFAEQLAIMKTDYTDFGFAHCVDEADDFESIIKGGLWDYMKGLKRDGVIRHLGVSSHDPGIVRRFIDTGLIDMVMFSINPAYDYSTGDYAAGSYKERSEMYRECEKAGIGISVMKPFGGGKLLNAKTSPFGVELTRLQCLQYALDRPAVLTVLPGVRSREELLDVLSLLDASAKEKDYSAISGFTPQNVDGVCVYCNHCQPCPMDINVGLVNKYYDLSLIGDELAKGHYDKLSVKADACIQCGHCESRCPFHVKQESRMREIAQYFA